MPNDPDYADRMLREALQGTLSGGFDPDTARSAIQDALDALEACL